MRTFEITIQRAAGDGWPVVAEYGRGDAFLSQRAEGRLQLDPSALTAGGLDHRAFGLRLGQALFRDGVRDLLSQATADGDDPLRMLLTVEAPDLRATHWERLCAPLDGGWDFLALDQQPALLALPAERHRPTLPADRAARPAGPGPGGQPRRAGRLRPGLVRHGRRRAPTCGRRWGRSPATRWPRSPGRSGRRRSTRCASA